MNYLDYIVIALYLGAMLSFGFMLRNQSNEGDFFLGGKSLNWFPLTLSIMATQLSAISFVSAPAFVGLREGGGLQWLTFEFAVPLAMILVMFVIAPALYRAGVVSIYEYLERKFDKSTRVFISAAFQISRSFATGIMVYAMGLIIQAVLGIPLWQSTVVVGLVTLLYATSGGMKAVVYGDAIQMILIFGGLALVAVFAVIELGGLGEAISQFDRERMNVIDFSAVGYGDDGFGFLPMIFGGFVLYASYYGCDQTQGQRTLSARSTGDIRTLLFANGVLRFPMVLLYCFAGLAVGAVLVSDPDLMAKIPADKPDYMMPIYIVERLPHGVIGLLMIAMLSAAMSSLSSAVNSLAAVTMEDMSVLGIKARSADEEVRWARYVSIFWGVAILLLSAFAGSIAPTVIEAINKVGSALYGPILAVFIIAMVFKERAAWAANIGLLAGTGLNVYFWLFVPDLFWMWWNFIGLVVTMAVTGILTPIIPFGSRASDEGVKLPDEDRMLGTSKNKKLALILVAFFIGIILVSLAIGSLSIGANL